MGIALDRATGAVTSWHMADKKHEQERADRNHERSEEAHWQVAEAAAEDEERLSEAARQADEQKEDWENEGGALDRGAEEATEQGDEIPVPKLGNLNTVSEPEKK